MPVTIDATVAGASANAFCLTADADAYFGTRFQVDAWGAIGGDTDDQRRALIWATRILNQQKWLGVKGIDSNGGLTQALAWPRRWAPTLEADAIPQVVSEYFVDISTMFYSSLTIPAPIVQGTCELALELLKAKAAGLDITAREGDPIRDIKRERVDVIDTEYLGLAERAIGLGRFPNVMNLITPLLRTQGAVEIDRV